MITYYDTKDEHNLPQLDNVSVLVCSTGYKGTFWYVTEGVYKICWVQLNGFHIQYIYMRREVI